MIAEAGLAAIWLAASMALLQFIGGLTLLRAGAGQLVPLIKAALSHRGFALLDVMSPCVTFNNHEGSTKSYIHVRDHTDAAPVDFVPMRDEIRATYDAGTTIDVRMHDGSIVRLHKDSGQDYDVEDPQAALRAIAEHEQAGRTLTGLLCTTEAVSLPLTGRADRFVGPNAPKILPDRERPASESRVSFGLHVRSILHRFLFSKITRR
jgi:hypothetical protein